MSVQVHKSFFCTATNPRSASSQLLSASVYIYFFFVVVATRVLLPVAPPAALWCSLSPHRSSCSHRCCCCCRCSLPACPGRRHCHRYHHLHPAAATAATFFPSWFLHPTNAAATMSGIAAASFFSNACRFGGCGLHFDSLAELIVHIEDNHIGKRRRRRRCCSAGWLAMAELRC